MGTLVAARRCGASEVELRFDDGLVRRCARPVLGVGARELFGAVGIDHAPARTPTVTAWAEVADADVVELPPVVHVPDPGIPAFRVSRGETSAAGRHLLVVELRHDVGAHKVDASARLSLWAAGLVRDGAPIEVVHRVHAPGPRDPSRAALRDHRSARARFDAVGLPAEVVGEGAALGADALAEQIAQGLRAAEATRR